MKQAKVILAASAMALMASGCAGTSGATDADAASYPDGIDSLTLEVPFDPGGTSDTIARLLAPELEERLGIPVQVLNLSARDGQEGFEALADATPDGSMIGMTNLPSSVTTYLGNGRAGYDQDSFLPLGAVTSVSNVVTVHADSEFADFADLVDAALASPGDVTLAAGALDDRVQVHQIEEATGAEFNKIPFEGGSSGEVTALLGKKVDAILGAPVAMIPNVESGDFRVVAIFAPDRIPALPDTPTAEEQGLDLNMESRIGVSLPAGTPETIQAVLEEHLRDIAESESFAAQVENLGYERGYIDSAQMAEEWSEAEEVTQQVLNEEGP